MFAWDYSLFAIVMITIPLILVFGAWIIYTLTKVDRVKDSTAGRLKQCPFCAHLSVALTHVVIVRCPCCGSFYDGSPYEKNDRKIK